VRLIAVSANGSAGSPQMPWRARRPVVTLLCSTSQFVETTESLGAWLGRTCRQMAALSAFVAARRGLDGRCAAGTKPFDETSLEHSIGRDSRGSRRGHEGVVNLVNDPGDEGARAERATVVLHCTQDPLGRGHCFERAAFPDARTTTVIARDETCKPCARLADVRRRAGPDIDTTHAVGRRP